VVDGKGQVQNHAPSAIVLRHYRERGDLERHGPAQLTLGSMHSGGVLFP
jgi:hypothetical protein